MRRVYLDYNATSPVSADICDSMADIMRYPRNASAVHAMGREGRKHVEHARRQVATLVGAPPAQVIFNSGATEGDNTVLQHFARSYPSERILVSSIEHPAVLEALDDTNVAPEHIPVRANGVVNVDALAQMLSNGGKISLVSVMMVNNETGVIQPIADIAALAHKHGALFHCDAVQGAGRIPIDITALSVDFMSISAHKLGGPQGVGALAFGSCGVTPILLHGGGQEKKARAGTENVAGIVGFGMASEIAHNRVTDGSYTAHLAPLRDYLERALSDMASVHKKTIIIHGADAPRVANTVLFTIEGMTSESTLMALDLDGIAVSNGSACSSGTVQPSHVLTAMGASPEIATGAIRVSMGMRTTQAELEAFITALTKVVGRV